MESGDTPYLPGLDSKNGAEDFHGRLFLLCLTGQARLDAGFNT